MCSVLMEYLIYLIKFQVQNTFYYYYLEKSGILTVTELFKMHKSYQQIFKLYLAQKDFCRCKRDYSHFQLQKVLLSAFSLQFFKALKLFFIMKTHR